MRVERRGGGRSGSMRGDVNENVTLGPKSRFVEILRVRHVM